MKVVINPDNKLVEEIRAKIKSNNGHCACAVVFTEYNRCICKEFKEQIEQGKSGECHCGLYRIIED